MVVGVRALRLRERRLRRSESPGGVTGDPLHPLSEVQSSDNRRHVCAFRPGRYKKLTAPLEHIFRSQRRHRSIATNGLVKITDRKSDIIITSGGKNITPSEIENRLKFSPYITDAIVIGDKRNYLTALVMIDQENVVKYAQTARVPFTDYASLTRAPQIRELVWAEVEKVNKRLANVERVRKIHLLEILLSAEDEEMTPTLKLRRKFVNEKYRQEIEAMYGG